MMNMAQAMGARKGNGADKADPVGGKALAAAALDLNGAIDTFHSRVDDVYAEEVHAITRRLFELRDANALSEGDCRKVISLLLGAQMSAKVSAMVREQVGRPLDRLFTGMGI